MQIERVTFIYIEQSETMLKYELLKKFILTCLRFPVFLPWDKGEVFSERFPWILFQIPWLLTMVLHYEYILIFLHNSLLKGFVGGYCNLIHNTERIFNFRNGHCNIPFIVILLFSFYFFGFVLSVYLAKECTRDFFICWIFQYLIYNITLKT